MGICTANFQNGNVIGGNRRKVRNSDCRNHFRQQKSLDCALDENGLAPQRVDLCQQRIGFGLQYVLSHSHKVSQFTEESFKKIAAVPEDCDPHHPPVVVGQKIGLFECQAGGRVGPAHNDFAIGIKPNGESRWRLWYLRRDLSWIETPEQAEAN
jgi:hypothetical protein